MIGDSMQKILYTGARSGIAAEVIKRLKEKDFKIYATVHNNQQLEGIKRIYKDYSNVECFKLDVTNETDRKKISSLDIDILVCNAAISYGGSLTEIDVDLVRGNYEVNVFSTLELIQLAIKPMLQKKKGKVIIMSSLAAIYPFPFIGSYSSTKAALKKIAETLKKELALLNCNIQVCLVEPGFYYTGFNQVMFDNKYSKMYIDSYFKAQIEEIRKRENLIHHFLEKKKLDSISKKIEQAIFDDSFKFLYRAPLSQVICAKLYSLFKE